MVISSEPGVYLLSIQDNSLIEKSLHASPGSIPPARCEAADSRGVQ